MTRSRVTALVVVAVAIGGVAALALATEPAPGPLRSGAPGIIDTNAFDVGNPGPWTIGLPLCLASGGSPATIVSIGPVQVAGDGLRLVGAEVATYPTSHPPHIGAADGFPPELPDPAILQDASISPAVGTLIGDQSRCAPIDPAPRFMELLIGLGRTSARGGGWMGIEILYRSGGHTYRLVAGRNAIACGPAAPSGYCGTGP